MPYCAIHGAMRAADCVECNTQHVETVHTVPDLVPNVGDAPPIPDGEVPSVALEVSGGPPPEDPPAPITLETPAPVTEPLTEGETPAETTAEPEAPAEEPTPAPKPKRSRKK